MNMILDGSEESFCCLRLSDFQRISVFLKQLCDALFGCVANAFSAMQYHGDR